MDKPRLIFITVEGGNIQAIDGADKDTIVIVIDHDTDGTPDEELTAIGKDRASVSMWPKTMSQKKVRNWYADVIKSLNIP